MLETNDIIIRDISKMPVFFDSWIPPQGYYAAVSLVHVGLQRHRIRRGNASASDVSSHSVLILPGRRSYLVATVSQVRYRRGRLAALLRWAGWIGNDRGHSEAIVWRSDLVDCKATDCATAIQVLTVAGFASYRRIMQEAERVAGHLSNIDLNGDRDPSWAEETAAKILAT